VTGIGTRGDVDCLQDTLCLSTIDDLEVNRVVTSDSTMKGGLLVEVKMNAGSDIRKIWQTIYAAVQISPDGLHLGYTGEGRVHQVKDVEGHFLSGESVNAATSNCLGNKVGLV
jgi:hypothetical protein